MTQTPRRWAAGLIAIALVVTACGSNDQDPGATGAVGGATSPASQAPAVEGGDVSGELTVWAMGNEGALLSELVPGFNEAYPDVTVSITPVDWGQAVNKLQTAIGGRQTPDISQLGTDMMGQFAQTGALEAVPANFDPGTYFESAWNTGVVDGVAYGVPWYVETRTMYWRSDLAEEAGLTAAPATWDELKAAAQKLKDGGAENGIALGPKNWQELMPFVWSNGGDVMNEAGEFTFDSPEFIEALTFYDSFFEDGLTPRNVPEGFDITPAFVSGTHPLFFSGPWHIGLLDDAGGTELEGKWDVAPLPGKDGAPGTSFIGGSNFSVFTDSENKPAAWAFLEYISRPEVQAQWYEIATVMPAVSAGWDQPQLQEDPRIEVFREQLDSTRAQPAIPTWSEIAAAINDEMERVTTGDATPEEAAAALQQKATSIGTGQ